MKNAKKGAYTHLCIITKKTPTMVEEGEPTATATTTPPETAAAPTTENGKDNNGGNRRERKDQVPIEELFDLSKPIPRVSPMN
jgi:hypothetical protein